MTSRICAAFHRRQSGCARSSRTCRTSGLSSASMRCSRSSIAFAGLVPARLLLVGDGPELGDGVSGRPRARHLRSHRHRRRTGRGRATPVRERCLSAAVCAGELRAGGARGDGVRGAGCGVACRWTARSDRGRRQRLPSPTGCAGRDGGERDRAAHRSRRCRSRMSKAACQRVRVEFCAERVVPMYEACYRELVS